MEIIIAVLALAVSGIALISNFTSNKYERNSFEDQIYQRFVQMWFEMDKVFIEHPEMHKYFYIPSEIKPYMMLINLHKKYTIIAKCIFVMKKFRENINFALHFLCTATENVTT